jgi:phosphomevalonate kinase
MTVVVSAPGKLMIAGEYAVLDGAEAIVAAVNRRAYVTLATRNAQSGVHTSSTMPMEALATRVLAEARVGRVPGDLLIDTSQLRAGSAEGGAQKLGLGSSAAAAAAVAGAIYAAAGRDVAQASVRAELLEVALEGHRSIAPDGSGADVAASVLGGFVRFRRLGKSVETHALSWPSSVELVVVWTGRAVRTSDMLTAVAALAKRDPDRHRSCMTALGREADQLVSSVISADPAGIIEGLDSYGSAMGALGEAAEVSILDETTQAVRKLARSCGGGAKPSGAGGGDVVVAGFRGAQESATFRAGCTQNGFEVLSLDLGAFGERQES